MPEMSEAGSPREENVCLTPPDERKVVERLENQAAEGLQYSIDSSWWDMWMTYTGQEVVEGESGDSHVRPGPIDNSRLLSSDDSSVSSKTVPEEVWRQLHSWYGGGPKVLVEVEEQVMKYKLKFYLMGSRKKPWTAEYGPKVSSWAALSGACMHFNLRQEQYYMYHPLTGKELPDESDVELGDLDLKEDTKICLLQKVTQMDTHKSCTIGRVGLENQGNTCYMNSTLQVMLHCPEIMEYFLLDNYKEHISRDNPEGSKGKVVESFADLAKRIWRVGGTGLSSYSNHTRPSRFWDAFSQKYITFASKAQHDTAEFAISVLDGLMEDCNRSAIPKVFKKMDDDPTKSDEEMANDNWEYHVSRSNSYITDKFHGQYRTVTTCPSCSFSSRKFESFAVLPLGLPQPKTCEVNFLLIDVSGNSAPRNMKVEVAGDGKVKDIHHAVAELLGEDDPEPCALLALGQKRGEGEVAMKPSDEKISSFLGFGALVIYHYPSRDLGPHSGGIETHFIHQKETVYTTHFPWPGSQVREKQKFGFPLVVWIPEMSTIEQLRSRSPRKRPHGILEEIFEASLRPAKRKKEDDVICLTLPGSTDDPASGLADDSGSESKSGGASGETWGPVPYGTFCKSENPPSTSEGGPIPAVQAALNNNWHNHPGDFSKESVAAVNSSIAQDARMAGELYRDTSQSQTYEQGEAGGGAVQIQEPSPVNEGCVDKQCTNEQMDVLSLEYTRENDIDAGQIGNGLRFQACQTTTAQSRNQQERGIDPYPMESGNAEASGPSNDCADGGCLLPGNHKTAEGDRDAVLKSSSWFSDSGIRSSEVEGSPENRNVPLVHEDDVDDMGLKSDIQEYAAAPKPTHKPSTSSENLHGGTRRHSSPSLEVVMGSDWGVEARSLEYMDTKDGDDPIILGETNGPEPFDTCNPSAAKPGSPENSDGTTDAVAGDDADSIAAQEGDGSGSDNGVVGLGPILDELEPSYAITYHGYSSFGRSAPSMKLICSSQEGTYDLMEIDSDGDEYDSSPGGKSRKIIVDWTATGEDIYNLDMLQEPAIDYRASRRDEIHTIMECFEHEFSAHPLDKDNLWKCGQCKESVEGIKSMRLWKTPDVLLISLKRFNFSGHHSIKLTSKVQFPLEGLDLSEFCESHDSENSMMYDLYGVCYHHGDNLKSGHYTSVVKMPDGEWCKFNDSTVSVASEDHDIVTSNAYLLCYRRRGAKAPPPSKILKQVLVQEDEEQQRKASERFWEDRLTDTDRDYGSNGMHTVRYGCMSQHGVGRYAEWNSLSEETFTWENHPYRGGVIESEGWGALEARNNRGTASCSNWEKNDNYSNSLSSCQVRSPEDESNELIVNGSNQPLHQSNQVEPPGLIKHAVQSINSSPGDMHGRFEI